MSFQAVTNSGLPFDQAVLVAIIPAILSASFTFAIFFLLFKTELLDDLADKFGRLFSKTFYEKDYKCTCSRCKYELRTKKGMKAWKRSHKFRKDELV